MVLSDDGKRRVRALWGQMQGHAAKITTDALVRMFTVYPSTKTYFPHFDLSPGSADIKAQGEKVAAALTMAVNNLDNLDGALSQLSDLHAEKLRVDPVNFGLLNHCIVTSVAANLSEPLEPAVILSLDQFLDSVAKVLLSRYR